MSGFIRIRVDDRAVVAGLRSARRTVNREANREIGKVVRRVTLPTARAVAPHVTGKMAGKMRASASGQQRAFIENKSPYAGLIEFGGTRRDVIRPKKKQALMTPEGPRGAVKRPRHYTGQHKMQHAIDLTSSEVLDETLDAVARAIAAAVGGTVSG